MKPCGHENIVSDCRICWLASNVRSLQEKWELSVDGQFSSLDEARESRLATDRTNSSMKILLPCIHEGAIIEWCNTCNGEMRHVRDCAVHEKCTRGIVSNKVQSCVKCKEYKSEQPEPIIEKPPMQVSNVEERRKRILEMRREASLKAQSQNSTGTVQETDSKITVTRNPFSSNIVRLKLGKVETIDWACAVTTVPSRRHLLEKTLDSIVNAGFPAPRIFVDVQENLNTYNQVHLYTDYTNNFSSDITLRYPNIRAFGNWFLALAELYIRNPTAHRYVFFQDDIILCKNVRQYLEVTEYPSKGYLNLLTYPQNEAEKFKYFDKSIPEKEMVGWYKSNQFGKGAQALVFDRQTLLEVLTSDYLLKRPQDLLKGHQNIDGGLSVAMKMKHITEYVHTPSLVRHTGSETTIFTEHPNSNENIHPKNQPTDLSFRGESWDALELIKGMI